MPVRAPKPAAPEKDPEVTEAGAKDVVLGTRIERTDRSAPALSKPSKVTAPALSKGRQGLAKVVCEAEDNWHL